MKNEFNNTSNTLVPSVRDKDGTGYDIFSLMLKERVIFVQGQVEAGMAGVIISQIKFLEAQDPKKPITMWVNSPGGSIIDGLAICDVMRAVSCQITTIGMGMQASMGSVILASGDIRLMAPNAQLLVHQGSGGGGSGTPSDLEIGRAFHKTLVDRLTTLYQDHIGLTKEYWNLVLNRDTWFTAEQAKEIGFIHGILEVPEKKKAPYAADRETSPVDQLVKIRDEKVAKYDSVASIVLAMNSDAVNVGEDVGQLRPELAAKLAQFPEFWTAGKKAEMAAAKPAAVSNDNVTTASSDKKSKNGPKAG